MRRRMIVGNWKMHGSAAELAAFEALRDSLPEEGAEVVVCPPATLIAELAGRSGRIALGAQDCHWRPSGAHTGDVSAEMLAEAGARYVIVGHSERRDNHGEDDGLVGDKAAAAARAGLVPIVCVGERLFEREEGRHLDRLEESLSRSLPTGSDNLVVAYEPVWAIGTGKAPTPEQVAEVAGFLRDALGRVNPEGRRAARPVRILYGGSVTPDNCAALLAVEDIDGLLVGGASLRSETFLPIVESAR